MTNVPFELDRHMHSSVATTGIPTPNQFVTFNVGNKDYGVDVMAVREIRSWSPTVELPDSPRGARGVLDIRGNIVEVYDLSTLLGGPPCDARPGHVVLVVSMGETNVGILVDSVSDIIFANETDLRQAPAAAREGASAKVTGLVRQDEGLTAILNLDALFPMASNTWLVD